MLFNSFSFIFCFLPLTLGIFYYFLARGGQSIALYWLGFSSLVFYIWWNPPYILLLLFSVLFNFTAGRLITGIPSRSKWILAFAILGNLGIIGYYKYFNFFLSSTNQIFDTDFTLYSIILPLGISFFTFQQIAFLVDTFKGRTSTGHWFHYTLFVVFFPQLIAGPIVHHGTIIPQFTKKIEWEKWGENIAVGLTIFLIGLFKKVVIADGIAVNATPVFLAADQGFDLTFFEAWGGALSYTFQLYFDFSGYSEMAVGAAKMFGIVLPVNFNAPYKAPNIAVFWQRWHITLSSFLKDYLYIPMGGNRGGKLKRYRNLMVTMLLGGLWHGAGWTFIIWGGVHGLYLVIFHLYRAAIPDKLFKQIDNRAGSAAGVLLTFLSVTLAWVLFRAESIDGAMSMYGAMFGMHGFSFPEHLAFLTTPLAHMFPDTFIAADGLGSFGKTRDILKLMALFIVIWALPSTFQVIQLSKPFHPESLSSLHAPARLTRGRWKPSVIWAVLGAMTAVYCIMSLTRVSEFLYFQF